MASVMTNNISRPRPEAAAEEEAVAKNAAGLVDAGERRSSAISGLF